jgi:DNA repair protein RadC
MSITDWPVEERPREKLLAHGSGAMSDAELLAIFLRTGVKGKTAVDLARELLQEFGGLRALLEADLKTFCQTKGLGSAKYVQLQAVLEMSRRYLAAGLLRGEALTDSQAMRDYVRLRLQGYAYEVFACLFLDNRHRVISFEELFSGTIDGTSVHPREVVRRALFHNAAAVILAHNHPSGAAEPSHVDQVLTRRLRD